MEKAEDGSYIARVKSLWLHPDQPRLPALRPTSRIKGQLWRNLNAADIDGYLFFAGKLKMDRGEDCLIFEVETVAIERSN